MSIAIREAGEQDAAAIAGIYNQGIEDRGATVETEQRSVEDIAGKLAERERYPLLVITEQDVAIGWAGLISYRPRGCYAGIAEFSIYLDRSARGRGLGPAASDGAHRRGPRTRVLEVGVADLSLEHGKSRPVPCLRLSRSGHLRKARSVGRPVAGRG